MAWDFSRFIIPLIICIIFWIYLAWFSWQRYFTPGSSSFIIYLILMITWTIGTGVYLVMELPQDKYLGLWIMFAGLIGAPSTLMFFFSQLTRQSWLNKRRYQAMILFEPVMMLLFIYTNPYHHLFIRDSFTMPTGAGFIYIGDDYGPLYWLHFAYSAIVFIYCMWVLNKDYKMSGDYRRKQIRVLMVAMGFLWLGAPLVGISLLVTHFDLFLLLYSAATLMFAWDILIYRLFDLMPISLRMVMERLEDGILLLDEHFRIADFNTFMGKLMAQQGTSVIGRSLQDVLPVLYQKLISAQHKQHTRVEYIVGNGENRTYYEMHLVTLDGQHGRPSGYLLNITDITERKQVENVLRHRLAVEQLLADVSKNLINIQPQEMNQELEQGIARVGGFLGGECACLKFFSLNSNLIRDTYTWHKDAPAKSLPDQEGLLDNFIGWAKTEFTQKEQFRFSTKAEYLETLHSPGAAGVFPWESIIAAPLLMGQDLIGVLVVASSFPNLWDEEDSRFLRLVSNVIVSAVVRVQTDESLQQSSLRIKCLRTIDQVIMSTQSIKEVAIISMRMMRQLIPYRQAGFILIDQDLGDAALSVSISDSGEEINTLSGSLNIDLKGLGKVTNGCNVFVDDILALTERLPIEEKLLGSGYVSYICSPLMVKGKFSGLLAVAADRSGVFTQEHREIISEISHLLEIGIYGSSLLKEQQDTIQREQRMEDFVKTVSNLHDVREVLDTALHFSVDLCHADVGLLYLPVSGRSSYSTIYPANKLDISISDQKDLDEDKLFQQVLNDGETLTGKCADVPQPTSLLWEQLVKKDFQHYLLIPIRAAGHSIGLLAVFNHEGGTPLIMRNIAWLEAITAQAGIAIQNTRAYQEEHFRVMELEALRNTVTDILIEKDLPFLLRSIVERAIKLLHATGGELALQEANRDMVKVVVSQGLEPDFTGATIEKNEGGFGKIAATLQPIIIHDYQNWEGRPQKYRYAKPLSFIGVPLIANDQLVGLLGIATEDQTRRFNEEDVRLLSLFGTQAALAIEKAMLLEEASKRAREAETLREATAVVAAFTRLDDTIRAIIDQLGKVVQYDTSSVLLLKDDNLEVVGGSGFGNWNKYLGLTFNIKENIPGREVYQTKKPVIIDNFHQDPRYLDLLGDKIVSWMGIPLMFHGKMIGMLTLDRYTINHFTEEDSRLGKAFADQVSIALENARLFDELQVLAVTDSLTGLYNRRFFMKSGSAEFERAIRYHRLLSIVMLDIDFFKRVNDTYGHSVGDLVLVELAKYCRKDLRESDILCRYGGEEFLVLLPETDLDGSYEYAERLRLSIARQPLEVDNKVIPITISLGVVTNQDSHPASLEMFIDQADAALYRAKQSGRNKTCRWDETLHKPMHPKIIDTTDNPNIVL